MALGGSIVFGLAISVAAQVGDLTESLFKREAAREGQLALIPGHGGLLDRLDSLLFVLPVRRSVPVLRIDPDAGRHPRTPRGVAILGSTGSIGTTALRCAGRGSAIAFTSPR